MKFILYICSITVLILSLLFGATVCYLDPYNFFLFIFPAIFAWRSPRYTLAAFLITLPVFGNRPGSEQLLTLMLIGSGLNLGLAASGSRIQKAFSTPNSIISAIGVYCIVSILSISSRPVFILQGALQNRFPDISLPLIAENILYFFALRENQIGYPILSVILSLFALYPALHLYALCTENRRWASRFTISILSGFLLSCFVGLLDYYNLINLRSLRILDPVVNPGNHQFRLQSFFGHSGWFAEYLTLTIPAVMILLTFRSIQFRWRIVLLLFVLLLGEYCLILTFQRGGWISYPVTLFAIWAAIFYARLRERGKELEFFTAVRRSLGKILLFLPLTVLISFVGIKMLSGTGSVQQGTGVNTSDYLNRLKAIGRTSDRTDFLKVGALIGTFHPILGAGSESFALEYETEVSNPEGRLSGKFNLPLHGSAHNVYAQTFAGKGLLGLLALLAIPGTFLWYAVRALRKKSLETDETLLLLTGICFQCAFLVYGMVQEVFYIQSLQYIFFLSIALYASGPAHRETRFISRQILLKIIPICLVLHLCWEWAYGGRFFFSGANKPVGCYQQEQTPSGDIFRWCGPYAHITVPATAIHNGVIQFRMQHSPVNSTENSIQVYFQGLEISRQKLTSGEKIVNILLPDGFQPESSVLEIKSSHYFIPKRHMPESSDPRMLSYRIFF